MAPLWPEGLGGIYGGRIFGTCAPWVDLKKAPGHTSQKELLSVPNALLQMLTARSFFMSPNLIWFFMTIFVWVYEPYDLEAASKGWAWDWIVVRARWAQRIRCIANLTGRLLRPPPYARTHARCRPFRLYFAIALA